MSATIFGLLSVIGTWKNSGVTINDRFWATAEELRFGQVTIQVLSINDPEVVLVRQGRASICGDLQTALRHLQKLTIQPYGYNRTGGLRRQFDALSHSLQIVCSLLRLVTVRNSMSGNSGGAMTKASSTPAARNKNAVRSRYSGYFRASRQMY